jgi:outer membrane protein assembly factor BamB
MLTADDLNEGTIEWQLPLGEVPELAARGIHNTGSGFPKVGPVVTAGGLIFAGTRDRKFGALDTRDGKELSEFELSEGMPAVYKLERPRIYCRLRIGALDDADLCCGRSPSLNVAINVHCRASIDWPG